MPKKKRSLSTEFEEQQQREQEPVEEDLAAGNNQPAQTAKKKPPKVRKHEKWTRIFHIGVTEPDDICFYDVQADVDHAKANPLPMPSRRNFSWSLLFNPDLFEQSNSGGSFEKFALNFTKMKKAA